MTESEKALLGRQGLLVRDGTYREFFQAYINNDAPFVTSDAVLHVYHILTEDSLENCDRLILQPKLLRCVRQALPTVGKDPEARKVLATLNFLLDPAASGLESERPALIPSPQDQYDYQPPINRARAALEYGAMRAISLESDRGLRSALLLSYALGNQPEWAYILRYREWLAGPPEDLSPCKLLELARPIFGDQARLDNPARLAQLREELRKLPPARIVDQAADTAPRLTFRVLPPGVTSKSLAFQAAVEDHRRPDAEDIVNLLEQPVAGVDLHSATMCVLNSLNRLKRVGPVTLEAWARKNHNAQLGAWTELEHALGGCTKDNCWS